MIYPIGFFTAATTAGPVEMTPTAIYRLLHAAGAPDTGNTGGDVTSNPQASPINGIFRGTGTQYYENRSEEYLLYFNASQIPDTVTTAKFDFYVDGAYTAFDGTSIILSAFNQNKKSKSQLDTIISGGITWGSLLESPISGYAAWSYRFDTTGAISTSNVTKTFTFDATDIAQITAWKTNDTAGYGMVIGINNGNNTNKYAGLRDFKLTLNY